MQSKRSLHILLHAAEDHMVLAKVVFEKIWRNKKITKKKNKNVVAKDDF